ncbi:FeoB-associated Cys-rich membrane protein [Lentisphaerota bacterium WC36G]|nr:FeoB-associated Cys-rich membrane protein [Lentisphaerae bacterium WC36]
MGELIFIALIIIASVAFLTYKFYQMYKSDDPCKGCGCSGSKKSCSKDDCQELEKNEKQR